MREWDEEISQAMSKLKLEPAREAAIVREISQHLNDCYQGRSLAARRRRKPSDGRSRNWAQAKRFNMNCGGSSAHRRKNLSCSGPTRVSI
jgi:hypothetical protein